MTNYLSPFLFNFNEIIELDTEVMIPRLRDQKTVKYRSSNCGIVKSSDP